MEIKIREGKKAEITNPHLQKSQEFLEAKGIGHLFYLVSVDKITLQVIKTEMKRLAIAQENEIPIWVDETELEKGIRLWLQRNSRMFP